MAAVFFSAAVLQEQCSSSVFVLLYLDLLKGSAQICMYKLS